MSSLNIVISFSLTDSFLAVFEGEKIVFCPNQKTVRYQIVLNDFHTLFVAIESNRVKFDSNTTILLDIGPGFILVLELLQYLHRRCRSIWACRSKRFPGQITYSIITRTSCLYRG